MSRPSGSSFHLVLHLFLAFVFICYPPHRSTRFRFHFSLSSRLLWKRNTGNSQYTPCQQSQNPTPSPTPLMKNLVCMDIFFATPSKILVPVFIFLLLPRGTLPPFPFSRIQTNTPSSSHRSKLLLGSFGFFSLLSSISCLCLSMHYPIDGTRPRIIMYPLSAYIHVHTL